MPITFRFTAAALLRKSCRSDRLEVPFREASGTHTEQLPTFIKRQDDPEALWVESQPENVQTYLKLKSLLSDIQREIDDCWAVLGEVYGPKEELRGFGIRIRRVKSNLQDPSFANTVTYVPRQATLHTAGVDLLKLLITPLYGDRPEVGIRELLQNAVDACRELQDHLGKNPQLSALICSNRMATLLLSCTRKKTRRFGSQLAIAVLE